MNLNLKTKARWHFLKDSDIEVVREGFTEKKTPQTLISCNGYKALGQNGLFMASFERN